MQLCIAKTHTKQGWKTGDKVENRGKVSVYLMEGTTTKRQGWINTKGKIKWTNQYMKRCLTSGRIGVMQIKMRSFFNLLDG